ncbi:MAG: ABC transporter ATP-binding protein [Bacilli bacterium]
MLKVANLIVRYGDIEVIHGLSMVVPDGEVVAFIGANGAGKTTILKTISRLVESTSGEIELNGVSLLSLSAEKIIALGLAHVPEGREVFAGMSVEENLEMGGFILTDKALVKKRIEDMYRLFPRLRERRKQFAGTLSGGEQQMLSIGRALMTDPSIILMDEPSMGLSPILVNEIFAIVQNIKAMGKTVLLVEQNAKKALQVADYVYVLETGTIVLEGKADVMIENDAIKKAYLGA